MVFRAFRVAAVAALTLAAAPAAAQQFSDGYEFLKAVREADGGKVDRFLKDKSLRIVNTRDASSGEGAIHIVAKRTDALYLRVILQQDDANKNLQDKAGNSALMFATEKGWSEGVAILIRYGANVNLANSRGETPLIRAVQVHNEEIVRALLDAGANPDKGDFGSGKTARDYANESTRWPGITKLIAAAPNGGKAPTTKP